VKYSDWNSQGEVDYTYFENIDPSYSMEVTIKYNILGDSPYHLIKPANMDGWTSLGDYLSDIDLKADLTEDEIEEREEYGGDLHKVWQNRGHALLSLRHGNQNAGERI
jgi:hypothetical protein